MRNLLAAGVLAAASAWALVPTAGAAIVTPVTGLSSPTHGVAVGADGDVWATEPTAAKVARIAPDGMLKAEVPVPAGPRGVAVADDGSVWVAAQRAKAVVRIDPATNAAATFDVSGAAPCGPWAVAVAPGGAPLVTYPNDGDAANCAAGAPSGVGVVTRGGDVRPAQTDVGRAFDVLATRWNAWVPDADAGVLRRLGADADGPVAEAAFPMPAGVSPRSVVLGGDGQVWAGGAGALGHVAENASAGTAATAVDLAGGAAMALAATGTGVVAADPGGALRYAGPAGLATTVTTGGAPSGAAAGAPGTTWVADAAQPRVLRVVGGAPRSRSFMYSDDQVDRARIGLETGGFDTTVLLELLDKAGGVITSASGTAAASADPSSVDLELGKVPNVSRIYMVTLTNAAGSLRYSPGAMGVGTSTTPTPTVPTPLGPAAKLKARVRIAARVRGRRTTVRTLRLTGLRGDEVVSARCRGGRGCPFTRRTVRVRRAGTRDVAGLLGKRRRLRAGNRLTFVLTAANARTRTITVLARKGRAPLVRTRG